MKKSFWNIGRIYLLISAIALFISSITTLILNTMDGWLWIFLMSGCAGILLVIFKDINEHNN